MPLSKQRNDLLLGRFELLCIADLHVNVAQSCAPDHALHRARVRHNHDVVLIHALCAQSLGCQDTGDRERDLFNSQNLADRIFVSVNLRRGRAPNDAHFARAAHVLRSKRRAIRQRPLANIEIVRRLPVNACKPILVSSGYLRG